MEIVFRSSFLLALTCSKRICFPPDTDSFCACERMGLEHLGAGTRGSGLTSYTGGGGAGRRNAAARPRSGRALWRLRRQSQRPPDAYTNLRFRASRHPFTGAASFPAAVYLLQVVSGCFT